jgi:hypothetical protein
MVREGYMSSSERDELSTLEREQAEGRKRWIRNGTLLGVAGLAFGIGVWAISGGIAGPVISFMGALQLAAVLLLRRVDRSVREAERRADGRR